MTEAADITYPHASGKPVRTLPEAFQETARLHPGEGRIAHPGRHPHRYLGRVRERVERIAAGLAALGVGHGDTVGIMLANRPEFHLVDTAALHLGAVPFSIYNTSRPSRSPTCSATPSNRVVVSEQRSSTRSEAALDTDGRARHLRRRRRRRRDAPSPTLEAPERRTSTSPPPGARSKPSDILDADLHLRHHRPAEGRRAHAREHARRAARYGPVVPIDAGRPDHLLPARRRTSPTVRRALHQR